MNEAARLSEVAETRLRFICESYNIYYCCIFIATL